MIKLDIQERWPELEQLIVKRPADAAGYAIKFGFRWPEAEPGIVEIPTAAAKYAIKFGFRWPEAEPGILGIHQDLLLRYINTCIKGRWEEAEAVLGGNYLLEYAGDWVRGRAPAIEKKLLDEAFNIRDESLRRPWNFNPYMEDLVKYSIEVIGDRWPEIENFVDDRDVGARDYLIQYAEHHRFRWEKLENILAKKSDRESIISYSQRVLKGQRSLVFEQYFEENPEYSAAFKKYCDLVDWSRPDTGPINDFVAKRMKRWIKAGTI